MSDHASGNAMTDRNATLPPRLYTEKAVVRAIFWSLILGFFVGGCVGVIAFALGMEMANG